MRYVLVTYYTTQVLMAASIRPQAWWSGGTNLDLVQRDVTGTISGDVKENAAAVARKVRLKHRLTEAYIAEIVSDATTGAFSFSNLDKTDLYTVVKLCDPNSAVFNEEVYDLIQPV